MDFNLEGLTEHDYNRLKKKVASLYEAMMARHAQKERGAAYANARAEYMKYKNLLQQADERYPQYKIDE